MKSEVKKSLLFISIDFPPPRTSGIYRPVFFSKYLLEAGWDITLMTAATHLSTEVDNTLMHKVDPRLKVIRISAPMPRQFTSKVYDMYRQAAGDGTDTTAKPTIKARFLRCVKKYILSPLFRLVDNFLLIPDNYIIWSLKNFFRARRIIKRQHITHLLVTSPPQSVQIMGLMLKKMTGVHLITDFRNSWTDMYPYMYSFRERIEKYFEKKILHTSQAIINMSEGEMSRLQSRMPELPADKLFFITNGYDEADFAHYEGTSPPDGPLRILYVGKMYEHSGDSTAEALKMLVEKGYGPDDLTFSIIGFSDESFDNLVKQYNLQGLVSYHNFMSHDDLIRAYKDYDVMHLVTGGTPYYHAGMLPGKVFEYMRLGKPVLHAGLDGTAHHILAKSGLESFVSLDDATGIAEKMEHLLDLKKSSQLIAEADWDYIRSYEWGSLVKRANEIISGVR